MCGANSSLYFCALHVFLAVSYGLFSVTTFSRSYEREGPRKTENEFSHDHLAMIQPRIRRSRIRVRVRIRVRIRAKEVSDASLTQ